MRKPPPLPAAPTGRSFTLHEQRAAGVAAQRAWRSDLRVVSRGVRVPWDVEQDFAHTCRLLSGLCPSTACCLGTAGRLWRCPLPWSVQTDLRVHLARFDGGNRPVRKGVAGHRLELPSADVTDLNGMGAGSGCSTRWSGADGAPRGEVSLLRGFLSAGISCFDGGRSGSLAGFRPGRAGDVPAGKTS